MFCTHVIETSWLIFSSEVPSLLYYSHIPTALVAVLFGFFVYLNDKKNISNKVFFALNIFYSLLIFLNLILWTNSNIITLVLIWPITQILFIIIPVFSLYFFYVFLSKKDVSNRYKLFYFILIFISIIVSYTKLNFKLFNPLSCELETTNTLFIYQNVIFILIFISILFVFVKKIFLLKSQSDERRMIIFLFLGILMFLLLFTIAWQLAEFYDSFDLEQYGLFGMTGFLAMISFLIIRFKAFNIKLITTQVFVWTLIFLIGSQFFFIKVPINFVLTSIAFLGAIFFGSSLIKSVKKEISQKEYLGKINVELTQLLKQRESLVHLITHKIKASFTRSKYIFAEMVGGSFGELSPELKHMAGNGLNSDNEGIKTVDLVLNAFNLEKGIVKYEMKETDFKEIVLNSIEPRKPIAEMKGLKLEVNIEDGTYVVFGDPLWLSEVTNNLIENSLRYTLKGEVIIGLEHKGNKLLFYVKDSGVGISGEDKMLLFTAGGRGKDSVKVNVDSTGYGLYSVKLIIDSHKGRIWADSEGTGKGSSFYVELDLIK